MNTPVRPWVTAELEPSKRKAALVEELKGFFREMWAKDEDDFRATATSTDNEDSVNGTVVFDTYDVAKLMHNYAKRMHPNSLTANALPAEIKKRMSYAQKDSGKDRRSIAAAKANYLAVEAAEPAGPVDDPTGPTLDSQHQAEVDQPDAE